MGTSLYNGSTIKICRIGILHKLLQMASHELSLSNTHLEIASGTYTFTENESLQDRSSKIYG